MWFVNKLIYLSIYLFIYLSIYRKGTILIQTLQKGVLSVYEVLPVLILPKGCENKRKIAKIMEYM